MVKPLKPEGEFCLLNLSQEKGTEGEDLSGRHCARSLGHRNLQQNTTKTRPGKIHVWKMYVTLTPDFVTTKDPLLIGLHQYTHSGICFKTKWIYTFEVHFFIFICVPE